MPTIGLDLTDPYTANPRDVDVAIVDAAGQCDFRLLPCPTASTSVTAWLSSVTGSPSSGDLLVIDGPLGLAASGAPMRECERLLGTPGKTPDTLPVPGSKPFAGYVRGSVELAQALVAAGWKPAGPDGVAATAATMLESFPGGTWTLLAGARMPHKATAAGIAARRRLLSQMGLTFARTPRTHDELDAALCAWLGWTLRRDPRVTTVGQPCSQASGCLREGVILQVAGMTVSSARGLTPRRRPPSQSAKAIRLLQLPVGVHVDWAATGRGAAAGDEPPRRRMEYVGLVPCALDGPLRVARVARVGPSTPRPARRRCNEEGCALAAAGGAVFVAGAQRGRPITSQRLSRGRWQRATSEKAQSETPWARTPRAPPTNAATGPAATIGHTGIR